MTWKTVSECISVTEITATKNVFYCWLSFRAVDIPFCTFKRDVKFLHTLLQLLNHKCTYQSAWIITAATFPFTVYALVLCTCSVFDASAKKYFNFSLVVLSPCTSHIMYVYLCILCACMKSSVYTIEVVIKKRNLQ